MLPKQEINMKSKENLVDRLQRHGGKFVTVDYVTQRNGHQRFCAKIRAINPQTVRIYDVNAKEDRTLTLSNVTSVSC